jgi:hypothetical protein
MDIWTRRGLMMQQTNQQMMKFGSARRCTCGHPTLVTSDASHARSKQRSWTEYATLRSSEHGELQNWRHGEQMILHYHIIRTKRKQEPATACTTSTLLLIAVDCC